MRLRKALIPAAGLGTRFLPATKVVPKELLPVVDRPALEYIVEELADSGIEEIVLVISAEKEAVYEHFQSGSIVEAALEKRGQLARLGRLHSLMKRVKFTKAYQPKPRGLGHAVLCGRDAIGNEPFAVVLPDDLVRSRVPCLKQLIQVYNREKSSVVAVERVPRENVKFYGIVKGRKPGNRRDYPVESVIEKPKVHEAPSRWAVIGRYVLDPLVFDLLERTRPGAIGEIQLTDALQGLCETKGLFAHAFEGIRVDTGQPHGWLEANLLFAMDRPDLRRKLAPTLKRMRSK